MISMFLLALVAIAILPLLIQSLTTTRDNVSLATATQLVSSRLEGARTSTTCAALQSYAASDESVTDRRGTTFTSDDQVTCSSSAGSVVYTARVFKSGSSTLVSTAKTVIYVSG
ncbi:hypothetical protein [Diaminobutyricimonas aerilata]|nr:hypothetical protein [Diaminobutyricimonas aerilata]